MKEQTKYLFNKIVYGIKLLSLELCIVITGFIAALITVVFFTKLVFLDKKDHFDLSVFELLKPFINPSTTVIMNVFTFFGGQYFLIPANLLLIFFTFYKEKDKWFALKVLSVAISSLLLMFLLKFIFNRPRPLLPLLNEVKGFSFPSGHAFMSFAFFGLLIYMVDNKVKKTWLKYSLVIFFLLITLAIGISRVYLRVHYASDVIAGFAISLVWLVISLVILRQIEKYKTINN